MFRRWLQHRLQKKKREANTEDDSLQESQDHSFCEDTNPIEVAVDALQDEADTGVETDSTANGEDDQVLKLDLSSQADCHAVGKQPQVSELLYDDCQSPSHVSAEVGRETSLCSEPLTMPHESCGCVVNQCVCNTKESIHSVEQISPVIGGFFYSLDKQDDLEKLGVRLVSRISDTPNSSTAQCIEASLTQHEVKEHITLPEVQSLLILPESQTDMSPAVSQDDISPPESIGIKPPSDSQEIVPAASVQENAMTHLREKTFGALDWTSRCSKDIPGFGSFEDQESNLDACNDEANSHTGFKSISDIGSLALDNGSLDRSLETSPLDGKLEDTTDSKSCEWNRSDKNNREQDHKNGCSEKVVSLGHSTELHINTSLDTEFNNTGVKPQTEEFNSSSSSGSTELSLCNDLPFSSELGSQLNQYDSKDMNKESAEQENQRVEAQYQLNKSECQITCKSTEMNNSLIPEHSDEACIYPSPCCLQLSCLYNQRGKLCRVLGQHFIVTYIKKAPILVEVDIEDSSLGPFGCLFVWRESRPIVLHELPDGTDVYFDAVVMPEVTKFIALVIWEDYKPQVSIEPYLNLFVFLKMFKNLKVHFTETGLVRTVIEGKVHVMQFHEDVVFIDKKNGWSKDEILKVLKYDSQQIFGDVCKFVTLDSADKVTYKFLCSQIWSGSKPCVTSPVKQLRQSVLYRIPSSSDCYAEGMEQLLLYCDALVNLIVKDNYCYLNFVGSGGEVLLPCPREVIYRSNKRASLLKEGKVRAHIRRHLKSGVVYYKALMVQIPDTTGIQDAETESANVPGSKEAQLHSIEVPEEDSALVDQLVEIASDSVVVDMAKPHDMGLDPWVPGSHLHKGPSDNMSLFSRSETASSCLGSEVLGLPCSDDRLLVKELSDMSSTETLQVEVCSQNAVGDENEGTKKINNKSNSSKIFDQSHFTKFSCTDSQKGQPQVFKNCSGKLCWVPNTKVFKIFTEINGSPFEAVVGKNAWLVSSGRSIKVKKVQCNLLPAVSFDIFFDSSLPGAGAGGCVVALWIGAKPVEVLNGETWYFYDIPGVYCGLDGSDMKFSLSLNNCNVPIKTSSSNRVFTTEGKRCNSMPVGASVVLHLRKSNVLSGGSVLWQAPLIIVHLKQDESGGGFGTNIQHQHFLERTDTRHKLSNSTVLNESHRPYSGISENPEQRLESLSLSSHESSVEKHQFVLEGDMPQYLKNYPGILMLNESNKIALFSCINGMALWTSVPENSFVCIDGVGVDVKSVALGTGITFDGSCDVASDEGYTAVLMWIGKRPREVQLADGSEYFYDMECVHQDFFGLFQFVTDICNVGGIIVEKTDRLYLPNGSKSLDPLMNNEKVTVHLRKMYENFGVKWEALAVFVNSVTNENSQTHPGDAGQASIFRNLEEAEQHRLKHLNLSTDKEIYKESGKHAKETLQAEEFCSLSENYTILEGWVEAVSNSGYNFTYAQKGYVTTMSIPVDISLDQPSCGGSTMKFNLIARNKVDKKKCTKSYQPVCGWFQKKTHVAYAIHFLKVFSYKPSQRLLCLSDQTDKSIHHFLCDSEYMFMGRRKKRIEDAILKTVHAVVEDTTPCVIEGYTVQSKILFLSSNMNLTVVSLKFLTNSHVDNEADDTSLSHTDYEADDTSLSQIDIETDDTSLSHIDIEVDGTKCEDQSYTQSKLLKHPFLNSRECRSAEDIVEKCFLKSTSTPLSEEKKSLSSAKNLRKCRESALFITENQPSSTENTNLDSSIAFVEEKDQHKDSSIISGESLRQMTAEKLSLSGDMNYSSKYMTFEGKLDFSSRLFTFNYEGLTKAISVSTDVPHIDCRTPENENKKTFLFVRRETKKETEEVMYHPFFICHRGKKCNPYIVIDHNIGTYDTDTQLLSLISVKDGAVQYFEFASNCGFTSKANKDFTKLCEIISCDSKPFFAVAEDISPVFIAGCFVHCKILLITTSLSVALASIKTFTCNSTEHDSPANIIENPTPVPQMSPELLKLFQDYDRRSEAALQCELGYRYHFYTNKFETEHNLSRVGGCLESHTDTHAFLLCKKKTMTVVCKKSNVCFKGTSITSWDYMDQKYWKNFFAIVLPLPEVLTVCDKTVDALAVLSWSCGGPLLLTFHECDLHEPTLIAYKFESSATIYTTASLHHVDSKCREELALRGETVGEIFVEDNNQQEASQEAVPLKCCKKSKNISGKENHTVDCRKGNNIFSLHDHILLYSGLKMMFGKITFFTSDVVVFACVDGELVWCEPTSLYIKRTRCDLIEKVDPNVLFCLVVKSASASVLVRKVVDLKAVIGFTCKIDLPGIHVCSDDNDCLFTNLPEEELAIARQIFNDIEQVCEQSDVCANYFLKYLYIGAMAPAAPPATIIKTHEVCCGVLKTVNATDPNKSMASIHHQGTEHTVLLDRKVFLGISQDTSLSDIVGCPIKVILNKSFLVVIAWIHTDNLPVSTLPSYLLKKIRNSSSSIRTKGVCCPRALVIQHFESVKKGSFKIVEGTKDISDDKEEAMIVFNCQKGAKTLSVKCKKKSVMSPEDNSLSLSQRPWNVLVNLASSSECSTDTCFTLEGVGAWRGTCSNLVIQVCKDHKVKLLHAEIFKNGQVDVTLPTKPQQTKVRCISGSVSSEVHTPASLCEKNKHLNQSDSSINQIQASSTMHVDHSSWNSGSLPGNLNFRSVHDQNMSPAEHVQYMRQCDADQSVTDYEYQSKRDIPLLTTTLKDSTDVSGPYQPLTEESSLINNSSVSESQHFSNHTDVTYKADTKHQVDMPGAAAFKANESWECSESALKTEVDHDEVVQEGSISYVKLWKFDFVNEHQGVVKQSGLTILIERDRVYVDTLKMKEPLTQLAVKEETFELRALVTCLPSPISILHYLVTHKALVAWRGQKPQDANILLNNCGVLQKFHKSIADEDDSDINTDVEQGSENCNKDNKKDKCMFVVNDEPQIVRGCIFRDWKSEFGILMSDSGYILFASVMVCMKKLASVKRKRKKMLLLMSASAAIMKLAYPIVFCECKITNVALAVWLQHEPTDAQYQFIIQDKLDIYRKDWVVELHQAHPKDITPFSLKLMEQSEESHGFNTLGTTPSAKHLTPKSSPQTLACHGGKRMSSNLLDRNGDTWKLTKSIEITIKNATNYHTATCQIHSVYEEFVVIKNVSITAIAPKENFYIGNAKLLSSFTLLEQLKNILSTTNAVIGFVTEIAQPIHLQEHTVTNFALLAYGGKQPVAHASILAKWEAKASPVVHLNVSKDCYHVKEKSASKSEKLELEQNRSENSSPGILECSNTGPSAEIRSTKNVPIIPQKDLPYFTLSRNKKYVETNSARIYKLMKMSGILEVQSEKFERGNAMVFFNMSSTLLYVNKKVLVNNSSTLEKLIGPLKDELWNCSARIFYKNSKGEVRKIGGVEVHYIATSVWYGEKLSKQEEEELSIKKTGSRDSVSPVPVSQNTKTPVSGKVQKPESVAERLRKQMQSFEKKSEDEVHTGSGAKPKVKKPSLLSWRIGQDETGLRGCITELHETLGRLRLENGKYLYFSRQKSFLYGVCLNKVELWHVLSVGMDVDCELTTDGKDIKGVWVGGTSILTTSNLFAKLREWCEMYSVPKVARDVLLAEAGWLPEEFNPTLNISDDREVVELRKPY